MGRIFSVKIISFLIPTNANEVWSPQTEYSSFFPSAILKMAGQRGGGRGKSAYKRHCQREANIAMKIPQEITFGAKNTVKTTIKIVTLKVAEYGGDDQRNGNYLITRTKVPTCSLQYRYMDTAYTGCSK